MANANLPRGLVPVRKVSDSPYTGPLRRYAVAAADATPLYIGDPVLKTGTADADGYAIVARAAAAGAITGVVQGFETPDFMEAGYRTASVAGYVLVNDDPDTLFEIQEDAVGGALAVTSVGLNADIVIAAPATGSRMSGVMLDTSTAATTATLPLRIVEFQHRADNEIGVANAKVLVFINNHTERSGAGL